MLGKEWCTQYQPNVCFATDTRLNVKPKKKCLFVFCGLKQLCRSAVAIWHTVMPQQTASDSWPIGYAAWQTRLQGSDDGEEASQRE